MKKYISYYILLLGSIMLLSGCGGKDSGLRKIYTEHYVLDYYDTQSIKLSYDINYGANYYNLPNTKLINIYTVNSRSTGIPEYDDGANVDKAKYEALCEKHVDIGYNRYINWPTPGRYFTKYDFTAVSITSDVDYDSEHPAGAELGDIVRFVSMSPIKYIRSGYADLAIWDQGETEIKYASHKLDKLVSELVPDDLVLIGGGKFWLADLEFSSDPTLAKVYNITVKMTTDTGIVLQDTVQVSWE
jgi:hypothetical protein